MRLDLTMEDVRFVHAQLVRRLRDLEVELAHTDKRELQASLAKDVARLRSITDHLTSLERDEVLDEFV
jgi:hypothetical protein